jgi:hypothetical protein
VRHFRQSSFLLLLLFTTQMLNAKEPAPAQSPPEQPVCKKGEIRVDNKCVAKGAFPIPNPGLTDIAGREHPGIVDPAPRPKIPRCHSDEVLIEGKCASRTSVSQPSK